MGTECAAVTSVSPGAVSLEAASLRGPSLDEAFLESVPHGVSLTVVSPTVVFQPDEFRGRVSQPHTSPPLASPCHGARSDRLQSDRVQRNVFQRGSGVGEAWVTPTFYPNQGDDPPSVRGQVPPSRQPSRGLGGLRILVVEDDPDARELVAAILEDAGAVVQSAESAAAGFAALQAFRPQLLVSDIGMPDEDGYSLIRRVRALGVAGGGGIPSIALTAYTQAQDRAKALDAGFNLHMGKPIKPTDLVAAVKTLSSTLRH